MCGHVVSDMDCIGVATFSVAGSQTGMLPINQPCSAKDESDLGDDGAPPGCFISGTASSGHSRGRRVGSLRL